MVLAEAPVMVVPVVGPRDAVHGVRRAVEVDDERVGGVRAEIVGDEDGTRLRSVGEDVVRTHLQIHETAEDEATRMAPGEIAALVRGERDLLPAARVGMLEQDEVAVAGRRERPRPGEEPVVGGVAAKPDRIAAYALEDDRRAVGSLELRGVLAEGPHFPAFEEDAGGDGGVLVADEMVGCRSVGEKPQDVVRSGVGRDITAKRELRAVADRADHVGVGVSEDGRDLGAERGCPRQASRRRLRDDNRATLALEQDVPVPCRHHPRAVRDGDGDGVPCVGTDARGVPVRAARACRAVEQQVAMDVKEFVIPRRVLRREDVAVAACGDCSVVAVVVGIGRRRERRGGAEGETRREQDERAERGCEPMDA